VWSWVKGVIIGFFKNNYKKWWWFRLLIYIHIAISEKSDCCLKSDMQSWAAWRSKHRIHLGNRRPGFESLQCLRFLGGSIARLLCKIELIFIACVSRNEYWYKIHSINTSTYYTTAYVCR
jgi:hypothetical protein